MKITFDPAILKAQKAREKAVSKLKVELGAKLEQLFSTFGELEGVRWVQNEQYNDETDEFGIRNIAVKWKDRESEDAEDGYEEIYTHDKSSPIDKAAGKAQDKVEKLLEEFDQDDMRDAFGDPVRITATRDGLQIDEWSND